MNEKKGIITWIKAHKKQLILAGIGITALIALVLGIKNKETLKALWASLKAMLAPTPQKVTETVNVVLLEKPVSTTVRMISDDPAIPTEVRRHIRNLHEGWKASPEKLAAALEKNIILQEGQTWVENYKKEGCAA